MQCNAASPVKPCINPAACAELGPVLPPENNLWFCRPFVGIRGSALAWVKSYLSDRHQFVAVNEEVSYRSQVRYRVPQGSVL